MAADLGIKTREDFQKRAAEVQARLSTLTLKECYENMGYKYDDSRKSHHLKKGVLAMANSGPNTNGSQFFINLADTPHLTGKHTVFGKIIAGMDIIEKMGQVPVGAGSKPLEEVKIISVRVKKPKAKP